MMSSASLLRPEPSIWGKKMCVWLSRVFLSLSGPNYTSTLKPRKTWSEHFLRLSEFQNRRIRLLTHVYAAGLRLKLLKIQRSWILILSQVFMFIQQKRKLVHLKCKHSWSASYFAVLSLLNCCIKPWNQQPGGLLVYYLLNKLLAWEVLALLGQLPKPPTQWLG